MSRSYSKVALDIALGENRSPLPLSPKGMGTSQDWCLRPVLVRFTVTGWMGVQSPIYGTPEYPPRPRGVVVVAEERVMSDPRPDFLAALQRALTAAQYFPES